MAIIRGFRELEVYKLCRKEAKGIFLLSRRFPREEIFSLTDQIRRSSRAVGGMIAEAWAHRRYEAAFISKLTGALGECMETQAWLDHAMDCGYFSQSDHDKFDAPWQSIGTMLSRMIEKSNSFCKASS